MPTRISAVLMRSICSCTSFRNVMLPIKRPPAANQQFTTTGKAVPNKSGRYSLCSAPVYRGRITFTRACQGFDMNSAERFAEKSMLCPDCFQREKYPRIADTWCSFSLPLDTDNLNIHDVRPGRACHEMGLLTCQGIELLKKRVRIVVFQVCTGIHAERSRLRDRLSVDNGPCRIRGAVRSVRAGREHRDPFCPPA